MTIRCCSLLSIYFVFGWSDFSMVYSVSVCFRYIDKTKGDLCRLYVFVISAAFQTLQKHLME